MSPIWKPRIFARRDDWRDEPHPQAPCTSHLVTCDTIGDQLRELVEVREPDRTFSASQMQDRIAEFLAGVAPDDYGRWVHLPWRDRLVHVLPPDEFAEVRLSRNRNKITREEQLRLSAMRIGVAGLSVGQASAVTLAMEGIGGHFTLADFDALSLSNLNRLRAGIQDIGESKAVLTARQLYEINPYLDITLFAHGIDDENIEAFLHDGTRLDLLIEECDDLRMKFLLRERARAHGIPVLMETSDRGMLDVERFDLEPDRPVFHGRVPDLSAQTLATLSPQQKVAAGLAIVGEDSISTRLAASAVEIGASLRSWPQLASAVALGAAINADTARRLLLNTFQSSGRFYVDLEKLVTAPAMSPSTDCPPQERQSERLSLPVRKGTRKASLDPVMADILRHAIAAPSGGNMQPWKFVQRDGRVCMYVDTSRTDSMLDYARRATYLAFGAALENAVLAAGRHGRELDVETFPDPRDENLVCTLRLGDRSMPASPDPLAMQVFARCTNRGTAERAPLPPSMLEDLRKAARSRCADLQFIEDPQQMDELGLILGRGDRLRILSRALHADLMRELRWSTQDALRTRDGIDLRTLELSAMDLAALRLTANWSVMAMVGNVDGGSNLERFAMRAARVSAAFGLLTVPSHSAQACITGGRALQRIWLTATALGLGLQPMAALPFLCMRAHENGDGLTEEERRTLLALRTRYRTLVGLGDEAHELMLFRLARVGPPAERALRRSLDDMLIIESHVDVDEEEIAA